MSKDTKKRDVGPKLTLRKMEPQPQARGGFCRRCLTKKLNVLAVEVRCGTGEPVELWDLCTTCIDRADHRKWIAEREKARAIMAARALERARRAQLPEGDESMDPKFYVDPAKYGAKLAEQVAQTLEAERAKNASYRVAVGPTEMEGETWDKREEEWDALNARADKVAESKGWERKQPAAVA